MGSRSARISLFVIALLASAGLGYLAVADERALATAGQDGAGIDHAAEEALSALLDVRGSMSCRKNASWPRSRRDSYFAVATSARLHSLGMCSVLLIMRLPDSTYRSDIRCSSHGPMA